MLKQTALVATASLDATNAFFHLLNKGASVNTPAAEGTTPLMEAVTLGDANLTKIEALIQRGANVNAVDTIHSVINKYAC
jgi:hypothetical protein